MSAVPAAEPDRYDRAEVLSLFDSLLAMRIAMASSASGSAVLDDARFENLVDHLVIVTPASQFGRYRFNFCGSTVAEMGRNGDVSGVSFADIMVDDLARQGLAGFKHVENVRSPQVAGNQPVLSPQAKLFTRLLMPLFKRDKIALMVGAVIYHDEPIVLGDVSRFAGRHA